LVDSDYGDYYAQAEYDDGLAGFYDYGKK